MKKILVVGSTNIDIIAQVDHLPVPGETVGDAVLSEAFGGKGANQAIAAARAGGNVTFITCLGDDDKGQRALQNLQENHIDTQYVYTVQNRYTGTALIFVDRKGENFIAVAPEANQHLSKEKMDPYHDVIKEADLIVMQLEIPYETVKHITKLASFHGKQILLNPAPARKLDEEVLKTVTYLILNETEAEMITGRKVSEESLHVIGHKLIEKGPENIILTLGKKGAYIFNKTIRTFVKSFPVTPVDTTAAGDTFCGAFATSILENNDLTGAARFANAAAAISVTRLGAQPSVPSLHEIERFLMNHNIPTHEK